MNALSFFVFLKNVFLNRHSCYYRIDNLNLRFAFLKLVISATIAVTILPNHLWIGRCRGQQFVVGSYNKKGRNLFCDPPEDTKIYKKDARVFTTRGRLSGLYQAFFTVSTRAAKL